MTPWKMKATMPRIIPESEIEFSAVRAQGPGGQNVHKVSSAVHLRFDIRASSLPDELKDADHAQPGTEPGRSVGPAA